MSGSEIEGQRREIFGDDTSRCDICGTTMPTNELRPVESGSPLADHDHINLICPNCLEIVQKGEIDVESFLSDEDDHGPERQW